MFFGVCDDPWSRFLLALSKPTRKDSCFHKCLNLVCGSWCLFFYNCFNIRMLLLSNKLFSITFFLFSLWIFRNRSWWYTLSALLARYNIVITSCWHIIICTFDLKNKRTNNTFTQVQQSLSSLSSILTKHRQ